MYGIHRFLFPHIPLEIGRMDLMIVKKLKREDLHLHVILTVSLNHGHVHQRPRHFGQIAHSPTTIHRLRVRWSRIQVEILRLQASL